jgi:hypothetical protein
MVSILRTLYKIRLSVLMIIYYGVIFLMSSLVPNFYVPIAFEAGGIATGPIVVPFIMAIGLGLSSIRSDRDSLDDSFGLVALVLAGPIFAMLLLGIIYEPPYMTMKTAVIREATSTRNVVEFFAVEMPGYFFDVLLALGCIVICFAVFQLVSRRYGRHQLIRIGIGFFYTLIGLVFFLTGVNVGFIPVGQLLGSELASSPFKWVLIPLGALIGYYIVAAEPAVHVLVKQVEDVSSGAISRKMMNRGLAIGMSSALAITMTRILMGIPLLWILVPGYTIALVLSFFVPKMFTGIAFDSGAVCSGPMSATFLLPLAMGVAEGAGRDLMTYAVGIVSIVSMTPLVVVQIIGLLYQLKLRQAAAVTVQETGIADYGEIILFGEDR